MYYFLHSEAQLINVNRVSKINYFYNVKLNLFTTKEEIAITFHFMQGKTNDAKVIGRIINKFC